jgi:hypothetical protein
MTNQPNASHNDVKIEVNEETEYPDAVWRKIKKNFIRKDVEALPLGTPIYPDKVCYLNVLRIHNINDMFDLKVRFVCISDTHSQTGKLKIQIPKGDVLIHAGDFTLTGSVNEIRQFNNFLKSLDFKHKFVIAGNHESSFENNSKSYLENCVYLEDSSAEAYGFKIYGTPWYDILLFLMYSYPPHSVRGAISPLDCAKFQ